MSLGRTSTPYSRGLLYGGLASIIGAIITRIPIDLTLAAGVGLSVVAQDLTLIALSARLGKSASNQQPSELIGYVIAVTIGSVAISVLSLAYLIYFGGLLATPLDFFVRFMPNRFDLFLRLLRPLRTVSEPLIMATIGVSLGYTLNLGGILSDDQNPRDSLTSTDTSHQSPVTPPSSQEEQASTHQSTTSDTGVASINGVALEGTVTIENAADTSNAFMIRVRNQEEILLKKSVALDAGQSHVLSGVPPVGGFEIAAKSRQGATARTTVSNNGTAPTDAIITATNDTFQIKTK